MTKEGQRGAALVIVVWALAIISAVTAGYLARSLLEARAVQDRLREQAARSLATAGAALFIERFLADEDGVDGRDEDWLLAGACTPPEFKEGVVTGRVFDCGGRINLNLADESQLLILFDNGRAQVDAVLSRRDADSGQGGSGMDSSAPVPPLGGFFQCPEEALLVKGLEEYRSLLEEEATIFGRANPNLIDPATWTLILRDAGFASWEIESLTSQFAKARADAGEGKAPFKTADDLRRLLPDVTDSTLQRLGPYLTFGGSINPSLAGRKAMEAAMVRLGLKREKADLLAQAAQETPFSNLDAIVAFLDQGEAKPVNKDLAGQIFTVQTTLAGIDLIGRTREGAVYRIEAVVERYHPPLDSKHWRCRVLYWREGPERLEAPPPGNIQPGVGDRS